MSKEERPMQRGGISRDMIKCVTSIKFTFTVCLTAMEAYLQKYRVKLHLWKMERVYGPGKVLEAEMRGKYWKLKSFARSLVLISSR